MYGWKCVLFWEECELSEFCPSGHHSGGHPHTGQGKVELNQGRQSHTPLHCFSANHDTFADNDSNVESDVRMTAPTVNTGGLCGYLHIEGAEVPLLTMQSAMLQSVHSGSGPVPCTLHYSTLPHYLAQRGLALNTSRWMLLTYNLQLNIITLYICICLSLIDCLHESRN